MIIYILIICILSELILGFFAFEIINSYKGKKMNLQAISQATFQILFPIIGFLLCYFTHSAWIRRIIIAYVLYKVFVFYMHTKDD